MTNSRPVPPAIFRFTFAHLPKAKGNPKPKSSSMLLPGTCRLKIFGFFDTLTVEEVTAQEDEKERKRISRGRSPDKISHDRHQRTLLACGNKDRLWRILQTATDQVNPAYLAISLLKLAGPLAHGRFNTVGDLVREAEASDPDIAYLCCLDAPDVIVVRNFGGRRRSSSLAPMEELLDWMRGLRNIEPFEGAVERSLTMVACHNLPTFLARLAKLDGKSKARALVRITDMNGGRALSKLCRIVDRVSGSKKLSTALHASVGYYDVQGDMSVPEAAMILRLAEPFVSRNELTTSTCFVTEGIEEQTALRPDPKTKLLASLTKQWMRLDIALQKRLKARCLNHGVREAAAEAVNKFERLHTTGLIPGSRLLLWTCRDAMAAFAAECEDHMLYRVEGGDPGADDSEFYPRQREYEKFFRKICEELDRRVSLSLAAHTRFFPCSLEVPLKVMGALDVASRLLAASFRSYRCREDTSLLQVFTATSDWPSQFFFVPGIYPSRETGDLPPTLVTTMFSPRMVRHFYLALFNVMHEAAQCIIKETLEQPSFTALVFAQALVERHAAISTLAALRPGSPVQREVPMFMRIWSARFLADETRSDWWKKSPSRISPRYFATRGSRLSLVFPEDVSWENEHPWETQQAAWRMQRVRGNSKEAHWHCRRMYRDARKYVKLDGAEDGREASLRSRWVYELVGRFGSLPGESPTLSPAGEPAVVPKEQPYELVVSECEERVKRWEESCRWEEYIELASLVPFLRLFDRVGDEALLDQVLSGLVADYSSVWRDSDYPSNAFDAARRFVVGRAAMKIYRSHLEGRAVHSPCIGAEADAQIAEALRESARALRRAHENMPIGRARDALGSVIEGLLEPVTRVIVPEYAYGREVVTPMIINGMVRFLVRLMHIYRRDGENVLRGRSGLVRTLDDRFRAIFMARGRPGNDVLPVGHITELWALQYRFSEIPQTPPYRLDLSEAIKAAGW